VFANGTAGFSLAAHVEYGVDTGSFIVVPGVDLAAFFLDPNVYVGMPTAKLVLPVGWFVPFVEGGAGLGFITQPRQTAVAVLGGGGFMITPGPSFSFGVEAGYETLLGTDFGVVLFGPLVTFAF
jgi:hypothetical protein